MSRRRAIEIRAEALQRFLVLDYRYGPSNDYWRIAVGVERCTLSKWRRKLLLPHIDWARRILAIQEPLPSRKRTRLRKPGRSGYHGVSWAAIGLWRTRKPLESGVTHSYWPTAAQAARAYNQEVLALGEGCPNAVESGPVLLCCVCGKKSNQVITMEKVRGDGEDYVQSCLECRINFRTIYRMIGVEIPENGQNHAETASEPVAQEAS